MSGKKSQVKGSKLTKRTVRTRSNKKKKANKPKSVSLASYATNPMRKTTTKLSRSGAACHVHGTDFLTSITIGASAAVAGDVLYTCVVNPSQLGVSRLATMARLYERYKFKSLKFRYSPVANATVSGQLIGYVDYDTYDDPTGISGLQNLQRAAAHLGEKPVQVWQGSEKPVFWEIKDIDPLTDLYVDSDGSDPRWTDQGRFVLLAASGIAATTACGNIYLDYDIEFYIPQLESTPNGGYGSSLSGSTTCTTTALFGTSVAKASWSNIPFSQVGNVITVPGPATYAVFATVLGVGITATGLTTTGTELAKYENSLTSTTRGMVYALITSSAASFTFTLSASASTSVSGTSCYIHLQPKNMVSITERKLDRVTRLLKQFEFTKSLISSSSSDSKEAKTREDYEQEVKTSKLSCLSVDDSCRPLLTRVASSMSSSSSSSSSSGSFGSFRDSLDEQYVRVSRKS